MDFSIYVCKDVFGSYFEYMDDYNIWLQTSNNKIRYTFHPMFFSWRDALGLREVVFFKFYSKLAF